MAKFKTETSRLEVFIRLPIVMAWHKTWNDYSNISNIHGMKYIYDKDAKNHIRVAWAATILVMFALANRMAFSLYIDFINDPIRLIIESDHTNTAKLLYPAVTICPTSLFNHSKAKELLFSLNLPGDLSSNEVIRTLDQTYRFVNGDFKYNKTKIYALQTVMKLNNYTADHFFQITRWDINELFYRCRFLSEIKNCSDIFQVSTSNEGLCYSFNSHQTGKFSTRFKSNHHAMRYGLSFILKDIDQETGSDYNWFQLLIHGSHIYPDAFTFRKLLHRNEETLLRSDPTEIACSREVWRRLTVEERKCALQSEIKLRYFAEYHRQNCLIECRIFIMLKLCGCVPFYLFREASTLVCDFEHIPCLADNYERMSYMSKECKCVESCEEVDFSVRLTSTNIKKSVDVIDPFYRISQLSTFTYNHNFIAESGEILFGILSLLQIPTYVCTYYLVVLNFITNHIAISHWFKIVVRDSFVDVCNNHGPDFDQIHMAANLTFLNIISNLGNCYSVFVGISALSVLQFFYYFTFILKRNYDTLIQMDF